MREVLRDMDSALSIKADNATVMEIENNRYLESPAIEEKFKRLQEQLLHVATVRIGAATSPTV